MHWNEHWQCHVKVINIPSDFKRYKTNRKHNTHKFGEVLMDLKYEKCFVFSLSMNRNEKVLTKALAYQE